MENKKLEYTPKELIEMIESTPGPSDETLGNTATDMVFSTPENETLIIRNVEFEEADLDETGQDFTDEFYIQVIEEAIENDELIHLSSGE